MASSVANLPDRLCYSARPETRIAFAPRAFRPRFRADAPR